MFDALTLDQLRVLLAVVEAGSFSAAGRRLRRAQSAVSQAMANLEAQLEVAVFDRSTRIPRLTEAERGVVVAARRVCGEVDALRQLGAKAGQTPVCPNLNPPPPTPPAPAAAATTAPRPPPPPRAARSRNGPMPARWIFPAGIASGAPAAPSINLAGA